MVVNYVVAPDADDDVVSAIEAKGQRAVALKADVSVESEVEAMFARAIEHFSTLHIVVASKTQP